MISFVYFDVGGVAIKDFSNSDKWKKFEITLQVPEKDKAAFFNYWRSYDRQICLNLDVDALMPQAARKFQLTIPESFSTLAYFVDNFEQNTSIWPVVSYVKKYCKIGLLTNMYPRMLEGIKRRNLLPSITWDSIIDSSIENCQKPDKEIFGLAEIRAKVSKNEILFIDNKQEWLDAASDFGLQTYFYDSADYEKSSKQLEDFIKRALPNN